MIIKYDSSWIHKMHAIFSILATVFLISVVVSCFPEKTWYRKAARKYAVIFSVLFIALFAYVMLGRSDVKCTKNIDLFYDDSGVLCYKNEVFYDVKDIDKNKSIKIIGFKIISDDEAVIDLDDGRKSVIMHRDGKFDFLSYKWHKMMREIEDEYREKHKK